MRHRSARAVRWVDFPRLVLGVACLATLGSCSDPADGPSSAETVFDNGHGTLVTLVEPNVDGKSVNICFFGTAIQPYPARCSTPEGPENPRVSGPVAERLRAEIEGGTATVELTVERTDDEWQILEFKVVEFMSLSKLKNNTLVPPSTVEQ